jgi:hypothetical protein
MRDTLYIVGMATPYPVSVCGSLFADPLLTGPDAAPRRHQNVETSLDKRFSSRAFDVSGFEHPSLRQSVPRP